MRKRLAAMAGFFLTLATLVARPAAGQVIYRENDPALLRDCQHSERYAADTPDPPAQIAASLQGNGKVLAFRLCRDMENNIHYLLRAPRPRRDGICRFVETEIFPGRDGDVVEVDVLDDPAMADTAFALPGWTKRMPAAWRKRDYSRPDQTYAAAMPDGAPCPPGDDRRYIPVRANTATLKAFFAAWRAAAAIPQDFDRVFAAVPSRNPYDAKPYDDPAGVLAEARRYVFDGHLPVDTVRCSETAAGEDELCSAYLNTLDIRFDVNASGEATFVSFGFLSIT